MERLKNLLTKIDGKGYKAYKDIAGEYETKDYSLEIMNVQGDPFASPTMFEWSILTKKVFDSNDLITNKDKKLAFEDFILRYLHENFKNDKILEEIFILEPQVEILKRSVVSFKGERLFIKYYFNLPARGRNVLGDEAFEKISSHGKIIYDYLKNLPLNKARSHVNFYENIENLREQLKKDKIKVFVGEGTVFEKAGKKIPFVSPKSLLKEYKLDDGKLIRGMALKEGITLITGFDFQGKSTLLKGIMSGVYNKIEGCGREFLLTDKEAVNIMAEKGRSINGLDMSSFIKGEEKVNKESTSSSLLCQTANLLEAIEVGTPLLLIDEDNSVTNFLYRDEFLKNYLKGEECFTPFIEKMKDLYETLNISSIIVTGSLGAFIPYANQILLVRDFEVEDITEKFEKTDFEEHLVNLKICRRKLNISSNLDEFINKKVKIKTEGKCNISFGKEEIKLKENNALIDNGQLNYIGELIKKIFTRNELHGKTLKEVLDIYEERIEKEGIEEVLGCKNGSLVFARKYEVAAVINRFKKNLYV